MKNFAKCAAAAALLAAAAEAGGTYYFYQRTMKRARLDTAHAAEMSGTDWDRYLPFISKRKERLLHQTTENVQITSFDGLKLHAVWVPNDAQEVPKRAVICFHGYTSEGARDFGAISDYWLRNGFAVLMPDERAHGKSEGEYVGFGCLDRFDALKWIEWVIERCGKEIQILLYGHSMGGSTVLMTGGLDLPDQVKGLISDCAFTSPKDVFTHVLHTMYHLPAFPMIQIADCVNRKKAGYGLDTCRADEEAARAKIPILLIHGDADTFVPCEMCEEIHEKCPEGTGKLIITGAGHAESYYKEPERYEAALDAFIDHCLNETNDIMEVPDS